MKFKVGIFELVLISIVIKVLIGLTLISLSTAIMRIFISNELIVAIFGFLLYIICIGYINKISDRLVEFLIKLYEDSNKPGNEIEKDNTIIKE